MSMPKIEKSENSVDRSQSVNDLIESVALIETGLSHIINAEGEKLQKVIKSDDPATEVPMEDILKVNDSVNNMVNSVSKLEMIMQNKLDLSKELDKIGTMGPQGEPGTDGITPHIGPNGNWWIDDVDTGIHAQGEPGISETNTALSASNLDEITFDPTEGLAIPLSTIEYSNGFTVDTSNTTFTVEKTGSYLITYTMNPNPSGQTTLFYLGIKINDIINENTAVLVLKGNFNCMVSNSIILPMVAGSTFQLVVFDIQNPSPVTLNTGVGTSITALKIA